LTGESFSGGVVVTKEAPVIPNRAWISRWTANASFPLAVLYLLSVSASAQSDVVTDWNDEMLECFRAEATTAVAAGRNLAILHGAVYDAVNGIEKEFPVYRFNLPPPAGASSAAAVIGAAHEILITLYPARRGAADLRLANSLKDLANATGRETGILYGRAAAQALLRWRASDSSTTTVPYIHRSDPGQWKRTPPQFRPAELPNWGIVIPFVVTNVAEFQPPGPPTLTSERYAADFNRVKELGGVKSKVRTPEQTEIARFWSDFSNTATPPGHWNQIAQTICQERRFTLSQTARLFAVLNFAMADAGIVAWEAKYKSNFWRPVTAIHEAERDGNPATSPEPEWLPLLTTPPFPEYVSGHSIFSGAACEVLKHLLGTDEVRVSVVSDNLPGTTRSYERLSNIADEIGMSRVYGGIHFLSADLDGLSVGYRIGRACAERFRKPDGTDAFVSATEAAR
jgi:hypothetical protein